MDLNKELNNLWASKIDEFEVDLWEHTIRFGLMLRLSESEISRHSLVFMSVYSYFYINELERPDSQLTKIDYAELTAIHFLENRSDVIKYIADKKGLPEYSSKPNFLLEIWDHLLCIEAASIKIDARKFDIGYKG